MDAAADMPAEPEQDPRAAAREVRAERYFEHDLAGQRRWYGERAARSKLRSQALGMAVVAAGAGITASQVFRGAWWVPVVTALLGAMVTVAEGWRQIARYEEAWAAYRIASERMKREQRLYANGAGDYRGLDGDEEAAFLRFVEAVEEVLAEEQRTHWRARGDGKALPPPAAATAPKPGGTGTAADAKAELARGRG